MGILTKVSPRRREFGSRKLSAFLPSRITSPGAAFRERPQASVWNSVGIEFSVPNLGTGPSSYLRRLGGPGDAGLCGPQSTIQPSRPWGAPSVSEPTLASFPQDSASRRAARGGAGWEGRAPESSAAAAAAESRERGERPGGTRRHAGSLAAGARGER